jgi:hypothetical protein
LRLPGAAKIAEQFQRISTFSLMNQTNHIPARRVVSTLFFISLAASICISSLRAEDLKTQSGRTYKNATISRVEADGLVIRHKFGIVKVAFQNIAPESRETFNQQKAAELVEKPRREEEDRARGRARETAQRTIEESAERRGSVVAFEEESEAEAEAFAARIHRNANRDAASNAPNAFHVRGQIVAAGPTGYIVRCATDSRHRDSYFFDDRLIVVTSDINVFVQGDYMDLQASAAGKETTFRTYLGRVYPGRFPVYRVIRDRRPQICIGFRW